MSTGLFGAPVFICFEIYFFNMSSEKILLINENDKICRACMTNSGELLSLLNEKDPSGFLIFEMLKELIPLQLAEDDELTKLICHKCIKATSQAYNFKIMCTKSDITMRENLKIQKNCHGNNKITEKKIFENLNLEHDINYDNDGAGGMFPVKLTTKKRKSLKTFSKDKIIKIFKCSTAACNFTSKSKLSLSYHKKEHLIENLFQCSSCPFRTGFKSRLKAHMRIHTGEKPYMCDKCDLRFNQLAHLSQHKFTHTSERPFHCTQCPYKGKSKRYLEKHILTHTGEKNYMCDLCSFTCANHFNLQSHKKKHNEEKSYKCNLCEYSSNFKKNLMMHLAKHSGVKAHPCHLCEYKGSCAQNLRAHMISHSQERPFSCSICSFKTKTNSLLTKHLRTHSRRD